MPAEGPTDERIVIQRLRMTRVAKELFLSEWYQNACDALSFSESSCGELMRIREETARERHELLEVVDTWARTMAHVPEADERVEDVARVARRDFILALIDAKDAAGEGLERAALMAPADVAPALARLAAEDFRHANALRELLVSEVQDAWSTRFARRAG